MAIAGDEAWVAGAAVIIFAFPDTLSLGARLALAIVTLGVLGLAVAQSVGLRRMTGPTA